MISVGYKLREVRWDVVGAVVERVGNEGFPFSVFEDAAIDRLESHHALADIVIIINKIPQGIEGGLGGPRPSSWVEGYLPRGSFERRV